MPLFIVDINGVVSCGLKAGIFVKVDALRTFRKKSAPAEPQ
jgi:peroxiredoxin family protein